MDDPRCPECGSWDAECSAEKPQRGCGCARCLRARVADLLDAAREAAGIIEAVCQYRAEDGSLPFGTVDYYGFEASIRRLRRVCGEETP